jgi:hypothetical protein
LDFNDRVNVLLAGIALGGVVEVMSIDAATGEPTEPDDIPSFERMVALLRVLPLDGEATSVEIGFRGEDSSMVGFTVGDMGLGVGDAVIELGVE